MKQHSRMIDVAVFIILLISVFALFHDALSIPYYADDLQFVFDYPSSVIFRYFTHQYELNSFYRPLQAAFLASGQALFGMDTTFIHITHLILHALLAFLIYRFMKMMSFPFIHRLIAAIFMIVSQANTLVVLSNDTFSHLLGTLTGVAALYYFYSALSPVTTDNNILSAKRPDVRAMILAIVFFTVSLFSKEISIGYLPCLILIAATRTSGIEKNSGKISRILIYSAPFVFISLLYLWARSTVAVSAVSFGSGRYGFNIGINILINMGKLAFVLLTPVSSVKIYMASTTGQYPQLAAYIGTTVIFVALLGIGVYSSGKTRLVSLLVLFSFFSLLPVLILNHVSELYAYSATPFLSIITGIALGESVKKTGRPEKTRRLLAAFTIFTLLCVNALSSSSKAGLMADCGTRSEKLILQAVSFAHDLPPDGSLILLKNGKKTNPAYSLFIIEDMDFLKYAGHVIKHLSDRNDISLLIVDRADYKRSGYNELLLAIEKDGTIIPVKP